MTELLEHSLTICEWREDHKRGISKPTCSCGWEGPLRATSRTFWDQIKMDMLDEWRHHLPEDYPRTTIGTCIDADGSVHTGQAYVAIEGDDHTLLALATHLTPVALIVRGFWFGDVGDIEQAEEFIIPASRVISVRNTPWWDLDEVRETEMDEPPDSERILYC